ncbi:MAG: hypothetical protein Pars92KO_17470 [Parasphingorhabdus sp.]
MDEIAIKAEVLNLVRRQAPSRRRPTVATEFQISSGQTRADLAIMDQGLFYGIEIKSKKDSLRRLSSQAQNYRSCFDRTLLVLDSSHLIKYLDFNYDYCDVWTFDENDKLRLFHTGHHINVPDENLFEMLTYKERELAFRDPIFSGKSKRQIFAHFFDKKFKETSSMLWTRAKGRKIVGSDIKYLSRFRPSRIATKRLEDNKQQEWNAWLKAQEIHA